MTPFALVALQVDSTTGFQDSNHPSSLDWMEVSTVIIAIATVFLAFATVILAFATVKLARRTAESVSFMQKSVGASALQTISILLGTFENIGDLRGELKKALVGRSPQGESSIRSLRLDPNADDLGAKVDKLSAAFDRAAWAVVTFLSKDQIDHFLNVFGDVYVDFWAICFERIEEQQRERGDPDNRMYFEHLAYTACIYLSHPKRARRPRMLRLYESDGPLAARMHQRADLLKRRLGVLH